MKGLLSAVRSHSGKQKHVTYLSSEEFSLVFSALDFTTHPPPALHFKCFEWHTFRRLSNACHFRQQRQNVFIVSWNTPESWSSNRHNLHTASWLRLLSLNRKLNYGTFYNRDDSPTLLDWHICRLYILTFYEEIVNSTCPCMQILLPHAKVLWVVARALHCGC